MIRFLIPLLICSAFQEKKDAGAVVKHDYVLEITVSPFKDLPDDAIQKNEALDRLTREVAKRWVKEFKWDPTLGLGIRTETPTWSIFPGKKETFDFAKVKGIFEKQEIKKLRLQAVGTVTLDDKQVWLNTRNGQKLLIENRPAEKGKKFYDLVAWIRASVKEERHLFRIFGDVMVDKSGVRVLADEGCWESEDE